MRQLELCPKWWPALAARWLPVLLAALCVAFVASPAQANNIRASLLAEGPVRPGETVTLALLMQPDKGWHGYWSNPGDAGYGLTLDWQVPAGAMPGALQFPVPQTLLISGLMNHVYEHDYAVLVPFTVPKDASGVVPVRVRAQWLACTDAICVPERADLEGTVTIGTGPGDPRFTRWRAALPAPLGQPAAYAVSGQTLRFAIPFPAAARIDQPHLFIAQDDLVAYAAPQAFFRKGDTLIAELTLAKGAAVPAKVDGVLAIGGEAGGLELSASPGPVPQGGDAVGGATGPLALALLLGGALLGGLILNVMPCVFPILSLKALTLARSGHSGAAARAEGLAYTAGVMLACLALGGAMLALRAAGEQVGWAFQLQEPGVVAALLLLAAAITANFAGLYELPGLSLERGSGAPGSFATGLLAAFVATPCTGPFMAAAMGAALILPTAAALAVFAALGLGLALPFLALGFVPALRRMLPRPGPWMERFRRFMALPMGLTALALLWLASRLGGTKFAALAALAALVLLGVLWLAGRAQRSGHHAGRWALPAALALGAMAIAALPRFAGAGAAAEAGLLDAKPFSEAALAEARKGGKPVFVYFTADWCLSCKVNEGVAIETEATRDAFRKAGVVTLRGDWTRRDEAITRFLAAQGVAGVPLYLWYPADGSAPRQLPQVLGPATLGELAQ
jgi:DsbC/DsbD-like thiol-disulfide interchange protein/cytochrome c biogenesis protein CcdA